MKPVLTAAMLLVVALGIHGCGEEATAPRCDPGETKDCTCDNGAEGEMTCEPNGILWTVCDCSRDGDMDSDAPEADSDINGNPNDCAEGQRHCVGDSLYVCESGLWVLETDCRAMGRSCRNGACTIILDDVKDQLCDEGTSTCNGDILLVCLNGAWTHYEDCSLAHLECQNGECVCNPGSTRCSGDRVLVCEDNSWQLEMDCDRQDASCMEGACVPNHPVCDEDLPCEDILQYCFMPVAGQEGYCTAYCHGDWACPQGFACDMATGTCALQPGACLVNSHCDTQREYCDIGEHDAIGACAIRCDVDEEGCPEFWMCCHADSSIPQCEDRHGACLNTQTEHILCSSNDDCSNNTYCDLRSGPEYARCSPRCSSFHDCPYGYICSPDGPCVPGEPEEPCGGPCQPGYICNIETNWCVLNCPDCGPNQCCDAQSAPECYPCECENPDPCGWMYPCCLGYECFDIFNEGYGICIPTSSEE